MDVTKEPTTAGGGSPATGPATTAPNQVSPTAGPALTDAPEPIRATATALDPTPPVAPGTCTFFKKKSANKNIRRRPQDSADAEGEEDDGPAVQRGNKAARKGGTEFRTGGAGGEGIGRGGGGVVGRVEHEEVEAQEGKGAVFAYTSNRTLQVAGDAGATRTLDVETERDRDARAIRERRLEQAAGGTVAEDNKYHGINAYTDHRAGFRREHTVAADKVLGTHGPLRASAHVRMSVRFDYQPDICKDYKETGYCGYGDSCKFMHDRGDYKSGWQLDREWDEEAKRKRLKAAERAMGAAMSDEEDEEAAPGRGGGNNEEEDDDELPFACFLCRKPFVDPVMTRCKHYFCEHCALKHNTKSTNCFVCEKPTGGVFNVAHEVLKKQKEAKGAGVGGRGS